MSDLPPLPATRLGRYRPLYAQSGWWVRPHAMFFEQVEIEGRRQPRFAFVEKD
jgi:hypothetical protein